MKQLNEAKELIGVREVWRALGLPGDLPERDGVTFPCPFAENHSNGDRNPSFNIHAGGMRFKCFACGAAGGAVDLLALVLGVDEKAACWKLIELAGGAAARMKNPLISTYSERGRQDSEQRVKLPVKLPGLRPGADINVARSQCAESRGVSDAAVSLAVCAGVLRFGEVCGFPSWVLLDKSLRAAEARRLDRLIFPAVGKLGERKAHSLKGTDKSWPVGVDELRLRPSFRAVMLVEGGPDFMAALHFLNEREVWDVWPVAMLGRSTGGTIHPEALALLAGRKVRIFHHEDADGGGVKAARKWGLQLAEKGCTVDGFSFAGLRQRDGSSVKDLNDCCAIHPDDVAKLEGVLP
jgi:hypothetical protein